MSSDIGFMGVLALDASSETYPSITRLLSVSAVCCFFFSSRRRHTRFDCDWSSDVCSSDLRRRSCRSAHRSNPHTWVWIDVPNDKNGVDTWGFEGMSPNYLGRRGWTKSTLKIGRASCRERV